MLCEPQEGKVSDGGASSKEKSMTCSGLAFGESPFYILGEFVAYGLIGKTEMCADFVSVGPDICGSVTSCGSSSVGQMGVRDFEYRVLEDAEILHTVRYPWPVSLAYKGRRRDVGRCTIWPSML